jgi:hypothetical protein
MARRPKDGDREQRVGEVADAFLTAIKAEKRSAEAPLGGHTSSGRGGYFFVATNEELAELDLAVGPATSEAYPHLYEPSYVAEIARCAIGSESPLPLEHVGSAGGAAVYRFPSAATDALAELTPARIDFARLRLDEITDRLMRSPGLPPKVQRGGAAAAVLTLRGHCLEARAVPGREVYYWFWRRADA